MTTAIAWVVLVSMATVVVTGPFALFYVIDWLVRRIVRRKG